MLQTDSVIKDFLIILITIVVIVLTYYKWKFQYWKRKNIPYLPPRIPFGNLDNPLIQKDSFGLQMFHLYKTMKANKWRHGGFFMLARPSYYVIHPDLIRNILAKDFQYFIDRGFYYNEKHDPISAHLFALGGQKWRNLRMKLTPTFTSGKMKMMFSTIIECEANLQKRILEESQRNEAIDIKEVLACFTTDVIASCAFGLDSHTCNEEEESPLRIYGKRILVASGLETLKQIIGMNFPDLAKRFAVTVTPKEVADFFMKLVTDTVNYRERNKVTRQDFLQLLIDLKNNKLAEEDGYQHDGRTLTLEEIAAQSVVFFIAGFETSSSTMAFALYELSKHPQIQNKLRKEVEEVLKKYNNKITYEAIQEMRYMDQVLDETLRKYPPVSFLTRECVKDYTNPEENLTLEKGTSVLIPILGLHYDEEFFPEPEKFNPERFTEENKTSRHKYVYIPFGEGPRMCIGLRFGIMQSKVGLAALLKTFQFTVNNKTKEPFTYKPESFVLAVKDEIWLNAHQLTCSVNVHNDESK